MKLKSLTAFEKQLRQSAPLHFSKIYMILLSDPYERKYYVAKLFNFLSHYKPDLKFYSGEEHLEAGLFSEERVVHVENEKLLKNLAKDVIVIYSSDKCSNSTYEAIEKEVICLDLSSEKPWEKKERHIEELQKIAKFNQKSISIQLTNRLIEQVGTDFSILKNEMDKLVLFASDKKVIEESDIEQVTKTEKEVTSWQIAESIVWRTKEIKRGEFKDLSEVLAIIALLRHHIWIGIQICRGQEIPNLRKNQLDVYIPFCQKVGVDHFFDRLSLLFEWELKAKSSSFDPQILWDLLVINYDTISTSKFASSRS
jgi:hypothetical protein